MPMLTMFLRLEPPGFPATRYKEPDALDVLGPPLFVGRAVRPEEVDPDDSSPLARSTAVPSRREERAADGVHRKRAVEVPGSC